MLPAGGTECRRARQQDQDIEARHELVDMGKTGDVGGRDAVSKGAVHALSPLKTGRSPTHLSAAEMGLAGVRL